MNKVIGLVGEDPNDTTSIRHLLEQKICVNISYITLIKRITGSNLDNPRAKATLKIECARKRPDLIIVIRDADGIITDHVKIEKRRRWYSDLSKELNTPNILLLNVYELEALIFADIDVFNREYKTKIKGGRDVTYIEDPKKKLENYTKERYKESDCPKIFKQLNIDNIIKNCGYFRRFYEDVVRTVGKQHLAK
jgi:hypothetical protein